LALVDLALEDQSGTLQQSAVSNSLLEVVVFICNACQVGRGNQSGNESSLVVGRATLEFQISSVNDVLLIDSSQVVNIDPELGPSLIAVKDI
jgi:hypothetical protein